MIKVGDKLPLFKFTNRVAGDFVNVDLNKEVAGKKQLVFQGIITAEPVAAGASDESGT